MTYEDKRRYERLISRDEEQEWVERNKQIDYINAVKWCRNYRKELINNKTNIVFDSDTDAIQSAIRIIKEHSWDSTKIEEGWHYLSSTKEYLININENIALFNALDTTDSDCEKFVKFFSPFLLAIALGIRLSKVTAQLREASSKTEQLKTN